MQHLKALLCVHLRVHLAFRPYLLFIIKLMLLFKRFGFKILFLAFIRCLQAGLLIIHRSLADFIMSISPGSIIFFMLWYQLFASTKTIALFIKNPPE